MPPITPIELAQKYLKHLKVDPLFVQRALLPSLFEENILCKKMTTDNLVPKNKIGNKFKQTHIYINKSFRGACFSSAQEKAYLNNPITSNNQESTQDLLIFEANIAALLSRRTKHISDSVVPQEPTRAYTPSVNTMLAASTTKLFNTQGSSVQVHIGIHDSDVFKDFRLGILLNDYLILLKYANRDCILAISIPSEFYSKYTITAQTRIIRTPSRETSQENKEYDKNDSEYSSEINLKSIDPEITPPHPLPAPSGARRTASRKTKYHGNSSRGKGALEKANYICEYDAAHISFQSQTTGRNYMEPHHLIPISVQGLYSNDIDITPNLICLCPTCHKRIHYGTKADVKQMLTAFYNARSADLETSGIKIDIDTLLAYYNIY